MDILVTGGAGFIGSHLVHWLVQQGHTVRVLDNLSSGTRERLAPVAESVTLITDDIRSYDHVYQAMQGVELVFHLAAMVSVVQSVEQPLLAQAVNATGTLNVLEAARNAGVSRVVHMSSSAVYGLTLTVPISEQTQPNPISPYGLTKLSAEQAGHLYTSLYGLDTVALRGFNIYGPGQDPSSPYAAVVPRFIAALRAGEQPTIYGTGQQTRDFIYVGDVVQGLWVAATTSSLGGLVFNIGQGQQTTIQSLAQRVGEVMGVAVSPRFAPPRDGEVLHSCADVSLLADHTGFRPAVSLQKGLELTVAAGE